jgi:CheY-like chemotaxis protein
VVAATDQEAEEKLSGLSRAPDVIIADYRLRDNRTGVQAIERLRARFGRDIPGVIVSGDIAPERLQEAQAGGHTLLHKPVAPAKLRAFIWHAKRGKTRQARV